MTIDKDAFDRVEATPEMEESMKMMRAYCKTLVDMVKDTVAPGRYQALALTHLELMQVYYNKGVTHDGPPITSTEPI